jgi:hypothetical protein
MEEKSALRADWFGPMFSPVNKGHWKGNRRRGFESLDGRWWSGWSTLAMNNTV